MTDVIVKKEGSEMTADEMKTAGFTEQEITMAEEQGIIKKSVKKIPEEIKKEAEEKVKADAKAEVDKKKLLTKKDEDLTLEEEHEKLTEYNANEKALYFKQKKERKRRQEVESENKLLKIKTAEYERQLKEKEEPPEEEDPERLITAADLDKRDKDKKEKEDKETTEEQERRKNADSRLNAVFEQGKLKYADFEKVKELAKEVLDTRYEKSAKVKALHGAYLTALASEDDDAEETAADIAYEIGKLHPDYKLSGEKKDDNGKEEKEPSPEDKEKVARILANKDKQKSSAAIGGGGGRGESISEDDLTLEDAAKPSFTKAMFAKLKPSTQDRLLRESCPK